jgi:glycosyltransferase involved in cell wall biosynthesis
MLAAPVFVFPSFAEGSARAVFEALACGCYVITTPNSGTIVEQGVHGALVPPGDAERLAEAIAEADRDRTGVAQIGRRNAELVAAHFRQSNYGDGLESFYVGLTGQAAGRE